MDSSFTITSAINHVISQLVDAHHRCDAPAVAGFYTPDAVLTAEYTDFLTGWGPIQNYWQSGFENGVRSINRTTLELDILEETVIEMGTFAILTADGQPLDHGKFLAVWKLRDGQWMIHREFYNSFPSLA